MALQDVVVHLPLLPGSLGCFVVFAALLPVELVLLFLRYELPFAPPPLKHKRPLPVERVEALLARRGRRLCGLHESETPVIKTQHFYVEGFRNTGAYFAPLMQSLIFIRLGSISEQLTAYSWLAAYKSSEIS